MAKPQARSVREGRFPAFSYGMSNVPSGEGYWSIGIPKVFLGPNAAKVRSRVNKAGKRVKGSCLTEFGDLSWMDC